MDDISQLTTVSGIRDELLKLGWSMGDAKAPSGYRVLAGKARHVIETTGDTLLAAWLSALEQAKKLQAVSSEN